MATKAEIQAEIAKRKQLQRTDPDREAKIKAIQKEDIEKYNLVVPENAGVVENTLVPFYKGVEDLGSGVRQLYNEMTGDQEDLKEIKRNRQGKTEILDKMPNQILRHTSEFGGAIAGTAPTMLIPGLGPIAALKKIKDAAGAINKIKASGNLLKTGTIQGTALGAVAPVEDDGSRTINTITGGIGGALGDVAVAGINKIVQKRINAKKSDAAIAAQANMSPGERAQMHSLEELNQSATAQNLQVPTSKFMVPGTLGQKVTQSLEDLPVIGSPNRFANNQEQLLTNITNRTPKLDKTTTQGNAFALATSNAAQHIKDKAFKIWDGLKKNASPEPHELIDASLKIAKYKNQSQADTMYEEIYTNANKNLGMSRIPTHEELAKYSASILNGDAKQPTQFLNTLDELTRRKPDQVKAYEKLMGGVLKDSVALQLKHAVPKIVPGPKGVELHKTFIQDGIRKSKLNPVTVERLVAKKRELDGVSGEIADLARRDVQAALDEMLGPQLSGQLKQADEFYQTSVSPFKDPEVANLFFRQTEEALEQIRNNKKSSSLEKMKTVMKSVPKDVQETWGNKLFQDMAEDSKNASGSITPEKFLTGLNKYEKVFEAMDPAVNQAFKDVKTALKVMTGPKGQNRDPISLFSTLMFLGGSGTAYYGGAPGVAILGAAGMMFRRFAKLGNTPEGRKELIRLRYAAKNPESKEARRAIEVIVGSMVRGAIAEKTGE
jgi:hypothetical protein